MKPIIYGIIGASVALVVTLIPLSYYMEQNRLSEINEDLNVFSEYESSMNNLLIDDCYSAPSSSEYFKDLQNRVNEKKAWNIRNGISEPNKDEYSVEDYKTKMNQLVIKYRDTEYNDLFSYDVYQCDNPKYHTLEKQKQAVHAYYSIKSKTDEKRLYSYDDLDLAEYAIRYNQCLNTTYSNEMFCKVKLNDAVNNYCQMKISSKFLLSFVEPPLEGTDAHGKTYDTMIINCVSITNRDIIQNVPINMESQQMLECINNNARREMDVSLTCIKDWN